MPSPEEDGVWASFEMLKGRAWRDVLSDSRFLFLHRRKAFEFQEREHLKTMVFYTFRERIPKEGMCKFRRRLLKSHREHSPPHTTRQALQTF